ncbi:ion channel [Robertkochia flava]|uniref:ion channel n=1 Tax=Robertkochia flava TaxID=3447986 RepID=UPI001CC9BB27|nr:ion channel [Robertkochia marina]
MRLFRPFYPYRFHLYLLTQLLVLFGSLLLPFDEWDQLLLSIFLLSNLVGGLTIISGRKWLFRGVVSLIIFQMVLAFVESESISLMSGRTALYLFLYIVLFVEIILQVIREESVGTRVILGMFSGYITLGFIGMFLLQLIMLKDPEALLVTYETSRELGVNSSRLMYFSFITVLTIGYGDLIPNSVLVQKTAVLLGLCGQFYITVVIALIVGKYLKDKN